jgi:hypothetical protein
MTGSLKESHYSVVREEYESDQRLLSDFSEDASPTTIAVVSKPRDTNIEQYCDEWWPELGMPEKHLKRFWKYRSGFKTNSAVDEPVSRAYEEARLDYHYRNYVQTSEKAQAALSRIVRRLNDGEDLTLVCFEEPHEPCHKYVIMEIVESRLSSKFDFTIEKEQALAAEN